MIRAAATAGLTRAIRCSAVFTFSRLPAASQFSTAVRVGEGFEVLSDRSGINRPFALQGNWLLRYDA